VVSVHGAPDPHRPVDRRPPLGAMSGGLEGWALAMLCAELPRMRQDATTGGWSHVLDHQVEAVLAGGSAVAAWEELGVSIKEGLEVHETSRGDGAMVTIPGLDPITMAGDYVCPRVKGRCPRRTSRDGDGHPPRCGLDSAVMRFAPR
jgi:hypothetical protein